ncbi:lipoyl(octanoyl) transferase [Synchytrium endobioticum]|uniref:Octanoyltransferase n=1 Tax=Synchytrium endobioticum TaxID=286115 RepID=A0A507DRF1_9FUNG|nr:lipoyl(octanoyl) transferase [Synchytrium endobioticum]TPX54041.1 lipoyl(octanoyl) transferase [Synchytrium endobioticum]
MTALFPPVYVRYLGLTPYPRALAIQNAILNARIRHDKLWKDVNLLLLLQHPPTYTAGRRLKGTAGTEGNRLRALGAEYYEVMRGGQTTFHGPGQLVGYPMLDLRQYQLSVRSYVAALETTLVRICSLYGMKAHTTTDTGVWVNDRKIAAIGVHVSRHIACHGFALNCNTDLSWYQHIVACGIPDKATTSLSEELNRDQSVENTMKHVSNALGDVLRTRVVDKLPSIEHDVAWDKLTSYVILSSTDKHCEVPISVNS